MERTLDCKLNWYPKFCKHVLLTFLDWKLSDTDKRMDRQKQFLYNILCFRYFAEEYGYVSGAENMKKEIYKRGPIGNLLLYI